MDSPENNFSLTETVSFRKPWKVREITAYKENLGEDSGAGYAAAQGSSQRTVALSARSQRACSSCATSQRALPNDGKNAHCAGSCTHTGKDLVGL